MGDDGKIEASASRTPRPARPRPCRWAAPSSRSATPRGRSWWSARSRPTTRATFRSRSPRPRPSSPASSPSATSSTTPTARRSQPPAPAPRARWTQSGICATPRAPTPRPTGARRPAPSSRRSKRVQLTFRLTRRPLRAGEAAQGSRMRPRAALGGGGGGGTRLGGAAVTREVLELDWDFNERSGSGEDDAGFELMGLVSRAGRRRPRRRRLPGDPLGQLLRGGRRRRRPRRGRARRRLARRPLGLQLARDDDRGLPRRHGPGDADRRRLAGDGRAHPRLRSRCRRRRRCWWAPATSTTPEKVRLDESAVRLGRACEPARRPAPCWRRSTASTPARAASTCTWTSTCSTPARRRSTSTAPPAASAPTSSRRSSARCSIATRFGRCR